MNKFDNDHVNPSPATVKELNEATRKPDGNGILLQPHQARLRRGGNHPTNGGRHQVGMNSDVSLFLSQCQGVSLAGNVDSLVSDGARTKQALSQPCFQKQMQSYCHLVLIHN